MKIIIDKNEGTVKLSPVTEDENEVVRFIVANLKKNDLLEYRGAQIEEAGGRERLTGLDLNIESVDAGSGLKKSESRHKTILRTFTLCATSADDWEYLRYLRAMLFLGTTGVLIYLRADESGSQPELTFTGHY